MAGGIFVDQPFSLNPKCVVFGVSLCLAYWNLPAKRNSWMILFIFSLGYITMAWYDHMYKCQGKMYSGTSPVGQAVITSTLKPQLEQERLQKRNVYLFHMLVIAPLLIYVGFHGKKVDTRAYAPLLGVGILALAYHGYRLKKMS